MVATPDYYSLLLDDAPLDTESVTLVVAAGATRAEVVDTLGIDVARVVEDDDNDEDHTGWAVLELTGHDGSTVGVLGYERSGFGDPSLDALTRLSEGGRATAVVRNNILGHLRFGCARDGVLLFDDNEYVYLEDAEQVPDELRPLFDLVHDDMEGDLDPADDGPDGYAVGLAMAELVTGVAITADDLRRLMDSGFFRAPSLVYN